MADYQRFVSYLYEYQNNSKSKNCGFCRMELRDHNCRLEVHLKLPVYPFTPTLKVYVFVPSTEKLYGIFLGNASYHQGNVSGSFSFSEQNIKDSSYHFSQLGGVFIQTDIGISFASAWKDLNIYPDKFVFPQKSTQKSESCLPNSNAEITLDKPQIESNQPNAATLPSISDKNENLSHTNTAVQIVEETGGEIFQENNIPKDNTQEFTQYDSQDRMQQSEQNSELSCENEPEKETPQEIASALHTENPTVPAEPEPALLAASTDLPCCDSKPTSSTMDIHSQYPDAKNTSTPNPSTLDAPNNTLDNVWEMILKSYPQCHPFFDDEIHNCVQLSTNDIQKLSSFGYPIWNNAFFRHNCQSFQHFLIGRKNCNSATNKVHYILAVPGIYNPKEQYMASMFGFPYFKCSQNSHCRNNCWGYWYRLIPEHWNDCRL